MRRLIQCTPQQLRIGAPKHIAFLLLFYILGKLQIFEHLIDYVKSESSRQGVGTLHASSNFAASHWVIDNLCTLPADPHLLGNLSDLDRMTICVPSQPVSQSASLFLKKITWPILPQALPRNPRRTYPRYEHAVPIGLWIKGMYFSGQMSVKRVEPASPQSNAWVFN